MAPPSDSRPPDAIAPDGSEIRFLVPPPTDRLAETPEPDRSARRASLVEVRLAAGRSSTPVRHRTVEELWYVLAGRGRLRRTPPGGALREDPLQPGVAVVISTGWVFAFAAETDLRFLCHTAPPWPGDDEADVVG
jgi:mannose-6-phosphate isomerase-like protein (cupin superfamily)